MLEPKIVNSSTTHDSLPVTFARMPRRAKNKKQNEGYTNVVLHRVGSNTR